MTITSLDPTGKGQARRTMRWKTALNAFDIPLDGRLAVGPPVTSTIPVTPSFDRPDAGRLLLLIPRPAARTAVRSEYSP
ncbi:hypothetical protein GCM10011583_71650 [Streptomyces camponoticapitis]|uniref:Uncharacterized protein n=1 Tax=Streptomyces camponoticapitis TaxID=1616125 RepID=A0ABQ2EW97_9ACTN|nr:hypothetical protein GCM10011583_71650 [Streptomyces camponoticapitis]